MLSPVAVIIQALMLILGGAGMAGGIVIALTGHGHNGKLAFWVTIAGIVLSGVGFGFPLLMPKTI